MEELIRRVLASTFTPRKKRIIIKRIKMEGIRATGLETAHRFSNLDMLCGWAMTPQGHNFWSRAHQHLGY